MLKKLQVIYFCVLIMVCLLWEECLLWMCLLWVGTVIDFGVTNVRSGLFSKWLVRYVNFQKAVLRSDNKSWWGFQALLEISFLKRFIVSSNQTEFCWIELKFIFSNHINVGGDLIRLIRKIKKLSFFSTSIISQRQIIQPRFRSY